jgi:hypothetical protein
LFALKGQNWLLSCLLSLAIAYLPLWGKRASKQLRRDRCLLIYVTKDFALQLRTKSKHKATFGYLMLAYG